MDVLVDSEVAGKGRAHSRFDCKNTYKLMAGRRQACRELTGRT